MSIDLQLTAHHSHARTAVYHALAAALSAPYPGIFSEAVTAAANGAPELASPACAHALHGLTTLEVCSFDQLTQEYRRVMAPPGCRPPALYESLHRHGRLMGEATLAVEQWYRRLGVEPDAGELADHASVELAFLAGLAAAESDAVVAHDTALVRRLQQEQRAFLQTHAGGWLPELGATLATAPAPFYRIIGGWLRGFLQEERSRRPRARRQGCSQPALTAVESCTLCGLCTGRCPTGALRVVEDDCITALALHAADCTGCGRCVTICPEAVLAMQPPVDGPVRVQLRRSPRQACPGCGTPTVSRAELDGVLARLGDDSWAHTLQLCPACKAIQMGAAV